jgi:hypothetical protein
LTPEQERQFLRFIRNQPVSLQRALREGPKDDGLDRSRWDWYGPICECPKNADGICELHPRARPTQRPPAGDWLTWLAICGRGWGKTRVATEWARWMIETGQSRRMALVGSTASDCNRVLVEGKSGILSVCPPWFRPKWNKTDREIMFPNGGMIALYSAEEPDRLRGPEHDAAICDEIAAWKYPRTYDMLRFGLRLKSPSGGRPRMMIATTPRPNDIVRKLLVEPSTALTRGGTLENRANLAQEFIEEITAAYAGTRLGLQELEGLLLDLDEDAWFATFDPTKHVTEAAEFHPAWEVDLGIDCGVSMHVGASFLQVIPMAHSQDNPYGPVQYKVHVFGDYIAKGKYSQQNAEDIFSLAQTLPCRGRLDRVRLDPASVARTGVGPAAYGEFEKVFGSRLLDKAPRHGVADALDFMSCMLDQGRLLLHPRCTNLIDAFLKYRRDKKGDKLQNEPADNQSPYEDLMDSLRYSIRDRFPEGRIEQKNLRNTHYSVGI